MSPAFAKVVFVLMAVGWFVIRMPHARRSRGAAVTRHAKGARELVLLLISLTGLGVIPFLYVFTGGPRFASYAFSPVQAACGVAVAAAALLMFRLTHRALGRNWSVTLEIRQDHRLVTEGVYARLRHPMYTGFWLYAVAQALLLPNWVAGPAGLIGFGTLFFFRVGREEQLMLQTFGDEYRRYMERTNRIIPGLY